jgi:hypothetical protein
MPQATSQEIARAEETIDRIFETIYDICERIDRDRLAAARDKLPSCDTLSQ